MGIMQALKKLYDVLLDLPVCRFKEVQLGHWHSLVCWAMLQANAGVLMHILSLSERIDGLSHVLGLSSVCCRSLLGLGSWR